MSGTLAAYRQLLAEHPRLQGQITMSFLTESFFDDIDPAALRRSDILVLDMMNQAMLDRFDETYGGNLISDISSRGQVLAVGSGLQPADYFIQQGAEINDTANAYWQHGGQENQLSLLKFALREAGVEGLNIPPPQASLDFGFYYPNEEGGRVFSDWESFNNWREENNKTAPGGPRIAVGFYKAAYYGSETEVIDALIAEIEARGAEAIPFFGYPGDLAFERMLLDENGNSRADVALSLLLRFATYESAERLQRVDIPLLNMISLYGRSETEWRESASGLSLFEGTYQVAVPELGGLVAPTVIASREKLRDTTTGLSYVVNDPIAPRIEMAVARAIKYARLNSTPNADKEVALMYYNYPAGKANIGASYLNIPDSLSNMLRAMREAGYNVGDAALDSASILADITSKARNVGGFAPGELDELVAAGAVALVPLNHYRSWLEDLAAPLRDKILADWGEPAEETLMTVEQDGSHYFVIPHLRYGNILLMPQPARGWGEDLEQLYHAQDLAPPHQYVATYAWLRHEQDIDAVVHMGTHGTLEWLDGKDMGLSREDASDALMSDIPNIYIYNVDVVGEGLVARRRGMATLVDHMVPSFSKGGLYPEISRLSETINDFDSNIHKNPALADAFAGHIIEQLIDQGIDKAMGLELAGQTTIEHDVIHDIRSYLLELREQYIPYGLHAMGRLPTEEMIASTVDAIVSIDRSLLPEAQHVLAADMAQRIRDSATLEIDNFLHALDGGYIAGGNGGEPLRNPDAYPTGKNFYGLDPEKVPKKAAWEMGKQLADQMLADHLAAHGEYPRKLSFVIWGDETMRHEGVLESQIFHLLGTRPVWDVRDKVVGVEVVPRAQLGRPRVDIVIASAAEGMFNNVTMLMDEAVQKVKVLEELDNFVRDHYLATRERLMEMGYSEEAADQRAGVRIFDEPPGIYNLNTASIAAASGSWDSDIGMANDYINKMGHGFGNGFWGEPMQDVFKLALEGVEKVVHSSSTTLYGALDNDDFFMYMGGLAAAARTVNDGKNPELLVTNTRNPGQPEMTSIDKFIGMEFQSRYINPNWIEGMQAEGYAGARTMVEFVEYLWGWDATVTETVDDRMWQDTFEVYVQDRYDLDMQQYFAEHSPYAFQDMAARMLETVRKGYWEANDATVEELLQRYVSAVTADGINCTEVSCGNPRLMEYVLEQSEARAVSGVDLAAFRSIVEAALQAGIEELARAAENFAQRNDARINQQFQPSAAATTDSPDFTGFRMEQIEQAQSRPREQSASHLQEAVWYNPTLWLLQAAILALLLGWWYQRRRQAGSSE